MHQILRGSSIIAVHKRVRTTLHSDFLFANSKFLIYDDGKIITVQLLQVTETVKTDEIIMLI